MVDESPVRFGKRGGVVGRRTGAAEEDSVDGLEDTLVGEVLKPRGGIGPDDVRIADIDGSDRIEDTRVIVGIYGNAGGIEEQAVSDGEIIMDDDAIVRTRALGAKDNILADGMGDRSEMCVSEEDVEMVAVRNEGIGDIVGPASAEKIDSAFRTLEGSGEEVADQQKAIGVPEVEIHRGSRNLSVRTNIKVVGSLKEQIIEARDVRVGKVQISIGHDSHAAGNVSEVLAGDIADEKRGRREDRLIGGPLIGDRLLLERTEGNWCGRGRGRGRKTQEDSGISSN